MNRIRLLPEQVASQIAAGEVVERPASVVKELVENALDAQAHRIAVEIQAGGRSLIRVTDDGMGMSCDDALLCFERHATSKIQRFDDLAAISTMGFRGEALPSIASVSRLALTTRERDGGADEATQVIIHGGKILAVKAAAGPPGTTVEVRQLFYNVPARRKFLRSEETERAHVQTCVTLAAMAFPEVGFSLTHDNRLVWQLPPIPAPGPHPARAGALRERLRALYGSELSLIEVDFTAELRPPRGCDDEGEQGEADREADRKAELRVWGFIGAPGVSRATREDQHLFVNRRPVENRGLNYALLEGYHTALMKGRYPVCCVFLELDPAHVDVNIHPAKREVKFRLEQQVRAHVTQAVRRALLRLHAAPPQSTREAPSPPMPVPSPLLPTATAAQDHVKPLIPWPERPGAVPARQPAASGPRMVAPTPSPAVAPASGAVVPAASPVAAEPVPLLNVPLRLVGVIGHLYVVLESDRGMVLLDQHAAHERVLFEQMLDRLEQGRGECQRLLLPETIEVGPKDAQFLRDHLPVLSHLGISLGEFGERAFLLDGLPPFVHAPDTRQFLLEIVDELKARGQEINLTRLGEQEVAKTVCRLAVKARDPLSGVELEELIRQLRQCAMPYTCPHGRPTLIEINYRELQKKFGRIQPAQAVASK